MSVVYLAAVALFAYVTWASDSRNATTRYRARGWAGGLTAGVAFTVMTLTLLGWPV